MNVSVASPTCFSALQRAENSSNRASRTARRSSTSVSVLFSEPKIPQTTTFAVWRVVFLCFSALQRAENSSNGIRCDIPDARSVFQCSSASRKFLKPSPAPRPTQSAPSFSALQRAENSSNGTGARSQLCADKFQCSSASRKFLKRAGEEVASIGRRFQCSSASRKFLKKRIMLLQQYR